MATDYTANYNWAFPLADTPLEDSNGMILDIFDDIDDKMFKEIPNMIENWDTGYEPTSHDLIILHSGDTGKQIVLPNIPVNGFYIDILDVTGTASTQNISIDTDGTETIMGSTDPFLIDIDNASFRVIYITDISDWRIM